MTEANYQIDLIPAPAQESAAPYLAATELVRLNARLKAVSACRVMARIGETPPALVLAADTLVSVDGVALGKPSDLEHAFTMVSRLVGREHEVYTGVYLAPVGLWAPSQRPRPALFVERTTVTFHPLNSTAVRAYLAKINPLDKAGGYAAQEHGADIIANLEGSWTNVLGLPMETLAPLLSSYGISPATPRENRDH